LSSSKTAAFDNDVTIHSCIESPQRVFCPREPKLHIIVDSSSRIENLEIIKNITILIYYNGSIAVWKQIRAFQHGESANVAQCKGSCMMTIFML